MIMETFRRITLLLLILTSPCLLNAQKTMQHYLRPQSSSPTDSVVICGVPLNPSHPYVIVGGGTDEPINEDPPGPVEMSFGEIPYSIETTQTGQVHLNIPINSYASEYEFAPQLSLDYNSGRNSYDCLGKGWKLKGLPIISRTPKNFFTDGEVDGINLADNYTFALDGERLIFQNETNDSIRFVGQTSNVKTVYVKSNDKFVVFYPDGSVANMSGTDSINYCVSKLTQKDGQVIDYYYGDPCLSGNGHKYVSSISYGDAKKIIFSYGASEDVVDYYCAGKLFKKRTKLKKITVLENENDTITSYVLYNAGNIEDPLSGITQYFAGGKYYFPYELDYLYPGVSIPDNTPDTASLSQNFYGVNPAEYLMQMGRFSNYSEGEGFLMFKNKDSYYYNLISNTYKTGYDSDGKILVAHNSNTATQYVPCSLLTMGHGFVDAFAADVDGIHGEEIVRINNWKNDNDYERLVIKIFSASNDTLVTKKTIDAHDQQSTSSTPFRPKTFLTGDFNGDGKVELLVIHHNNNQSPYTHYRLLNLQNGHEIKSGDFNDNLTVYFPQKYIRDEELTAEERWDNYKHSARIFTIDYNGDGKQEIGMVGFDGFNVYEFYNDQQDGLCSRRVCHQSFPTLFDLHDYGMRVGEFNGDGIADILFYLETDSIQQHSQKKLFKSYLGKGDGTFAPKDSMSLEYFYSNNFYPSDVVLQTNMNGITDAFVSSNDNSTGKGIYYLSMSNGMLEMSLLRTLPDSTSLVPSYYYGECSVNGFLAVGKNGRLYKQKYISPHDVAWLLKWIEDSYHNTYNISYRQIYESDSYHPDFGRYQYPYTTFAKGQTACHEMRKYDTNHRIVESIIYDYGNAVMHKQGFGYIGFDSIALIDTVSQRASSSTYDIPCLGAPLRIEDYKKLENHSHMLTVTPEKRVLVRETGMSHYDKATCASDTTSYTYDTYGNVTLSQTLLSGGQQKTVQSQYINLSNDNINIIGLPSKLTNTVTNASGSVTTGIKYTYNGNYLATSEKKFLGNENQVVKESQRTYDSQSRITQEKTRKYSSPWLITTYSYNGDSRKPLTITDPIGCSHELTYGKFGVTKSCESNVSQVTPIEPLGSLNGDEINGGGFPVDPDPILLGLETSYGYDEAGNLTRVTNPDGTIHDIRRTWVYQSMGIGAKFFVTDSVTGQAVTRTYYNSLGQKTRVETQRPDGSYLKVDYEYDAMGRLVKQYEPYKTSNSLFTQLEYDTFDRLVSKTHPDCHSDTYSYNGLTTSSNVGGILSSRTVDELGNLVSVTDAGGSITYSMTADGRPLSVSINGEASTTFEYDTYGRKTAITDPSAGRTSYTYDSSGNIATVTDARGKTTTTTYNDFGKPTSSTIGNDMTVTYTYNDYQQPTSITCSNGNSKQYTYNKYHKLASETINGFKRSYNYSGCNVSSIGYSYSGTSLGTESYSRTLGTVTAINYGGKTLWRLDSEDDHAMPTAVSSSVVSTDLEYDDLHRVTSRIAESNALGIFHDMQYEYDTYGNMTSRDDGQLGNSEDFDYDNLNRLVSTPAGDISYDGKGNITEHDAAGVFGYASSRPYALSQITLSASDFPTSAQTITYNSMNRPDTISERGTVACLKYFEDGERSQMITIDRQYTNTYSYFGSQFTAIDYNSLGNNSKKQVLFLGGDAYSAPAAIVREKAYNANKWTNRLYYIVRDNLGSITHVVDSTGAVVQELSYDAWGRLRDPETQQVYAPGNQPDLLLGRGYCGHEHLADFNLINMNARLYDPWTARFLSPDPCVQLPDFTQSLNRYSYCWNNPLKFIDISGNDVWLIDKEGNSLLLCQSETDWEVRMSDIVVTAKSNNYDNSFSVTDWTSYFSYLGEVKTTRMAEIQYSTKFQKWTGTNGKIYFGLSGSGPNQYTGSRKAAKIKADKIRKFSKALTMLSLYSRGVNYLEQINNNPNLGPNMRKYLKEKLLLRSSIDSFGFSNNIYLNAFSIGYSLGELFQTITGINIQYNPYSGDFSTPIEDTLIQADELGFEIY